MLALLRRHSRKITLALLAVEAPFEALFGLVIVQMMRRFFPAAYDPPWHSSANPRAAGAEDMPTAMFVARPRFEQRVSTTTSELVDPTPRTGRSTSNTRALRIRIADQTPRDGG